MEWFDRHHGVWVPQGWGSTECSPLVTFTFIKSKFEESPDKDLPYEVRGKQGLPLPGAEIWVVDEQGNDLSWNGERVGEFLVRAPRVASAYYNDRGVGSTGAPLPAEGFRWV
jgi:fatty-acyl-CoA synthase